MFLINNVFVAAKKSNAKRNKTGFILYAPDFPPLNCRIKFKKIIFSTLGFIASMKIIKKYMLLFKTYTVIYYYANSNKILLVDKLKLNFFIESKIAHKYQLHTRNL